MSQIRSYMFFLLCRNDNEVIMHSWLLTHAWTTPCSRSTLFTNPNILRAVIKDGSRLYPRGVHKLCTKQCTACACGHSNKHHTLRCNQGLLPHIIMMDVGVVTVFPNILQRASHSCNEFFCSHWVTGSLVVCSHIHRQFWMVTDCDLNHSSKCGACWSDHTLINIWSLKGQNWGSG